MIHNLAYVHPDAVIGKNVEVAPFAYIEGDVVIGDNTKIMSNASVLNGARIGSGCTIHPGAVIAGIPQDLKFKGEYTTAVVGDNCNIRECATVNRGSASRGTTIVGNNCLMMAYSHVAHDCVLGNNIILANNVSIAGEVEMGDYAIMGGHSAAHQFCKIGAHAMIGGGSMILKDVPPYVIIGKIPAAYYGLNIIGLRRRGFNADQIGEIKSIYNKLYMSDMNFSEACNDIEASLPDSSYRNEIVSFVRSSERGIIRGPKTLASDWDE